MGLGIPGYIRNVEVQDNNIRYMWDDSNVQRVYASRDDEELMGRAEKLSFRANLALTIACAEWVIYRYDSLSDDRSPHQYLEASWAAVVDDRYLCPWELPATEWRGPVRGPMALALLIVQESVRSAVQESSLGVAVSYISNLAKHVLLSRGAAFEVWRDEVVGMLTILYPFDSDETLGEIVPREAFDSGSRFSPDETGLLINKFVSNLDPVNNRFLHSPEEMLELHFDGVPYKFDIQKERRDRIGW